MDPKERQSTVRSITEEPLRMQARLPLNDVYIALMGVIPHVVRSLLHRCLAPHVISRLPKPDREKPKRTRIKSCYFHIDIAELRYA